MIITISGPPGVGTTTVAGILSKKLGIPLLSAGDIFRQMAAEMGMDMLEFSKLAEKDHEIDIEVDSRQVEAAKTGDLIIEGRLSAYFVDADLKVLLLAPFEVRAERISKRESKPVEIVKYEMKMREESEAKRYKEIHGIDVNSLEIYDIILNSDRFNAETIARIILKIIEVIQWQR